MSNLIYKIFFIAIFISQNSFSQSNIEIDQSAPPINITNWVSNIPADKNFKNKFIVLDFWATWCGPCIAAVPHMNNIQRKFNQNDLYYISITDESVEKVERIIKRIEFKSIVVTDLTKNTQINFGDGKNGLTSYPLTILIDKKGIIKWIGEPKNLNDNIMSNFLSNSLMADEENDYLENKNPILDLKKNNFDRKIENIEDKYYFKIEETEKSNKSQSIISPKLIEIKEVRLEELFKKTLKYYGKVVEIPEILKNKHYNLTYKNEFSAESLEILEEEILKNLNLKKQTILKKTKVFNVSVQDPNLLEETLHERYSTKSDADDKIIFTFYTINSMLNEISEIFNIIFIFTEQNNKKYDFLISTNSKNELIFDLKKYGFKVEESFKNIEHIILEIKK